MSAVLMPLVKRAPHQPSATRRYGRRPVSLLMLATFAAACSNDEPLDTPMAPYTITVAADGSRWKQGVFLDRSVRIPDERLGWKVSDGSPGWVIQLPDTVRAARPREPALGASKLLHIQLFDMASANLEDSFRTLLAQSPTLDQPPSEVFPEWGLAFYQHPLSPNSPLGNGMWIPLDESVRSPDGQRPVMNCDSFYVDADRIPDSLSCSIYGRVSSRVVARISFQGNALPTWKIAHDVAWASIAQSVTPVAKP